MFPKQYLALCEHPMYLAVWLGDDSLLEKNPPWGEKQISNYINRFRKNLSFLDKYTRFKINFDISGFELEALANKAPDVIKKMLSKLNYQVCFIGGTYSQPHLHIFGPESNIKQFVYGKEAFKRIFKKSNIILTFFSGEVQHHQQLPQILLAAGYKYVLLPNYLFPVICFKDNHELLVNADMRLTPIQGEEFTFWEGLDDSKIPMYLTTSEEPNEKNIERERMRDFLRKPPLWVRVEDMRIIDEEWLREMSKNASFALLDEFLEKRISIAPPKTRALLSLYWAYAEGVWGEALSRKNRYAESILAIASAINAMSWLLTGKQPENLEEAWKKVLASQHHDIYWAETTSLKKLALRWLGEAIEEGRRAINSALHSLCSKINTEEVEGEPLIVFNVHPWFRKDVVEVDVELPPNWKGLEVLSEDYEKVPSYFSVLESNNDGTIKKAHVVFIAEVPPFGYRTYILQSSSYNQIITQELTKPVSIENEFVKLIVDTNINIRSIISKANGYEFIDASNYLGNELRYSVPKGSEANWVTSTKQHCKAKLVHTPCFTEISSEGYLGEVECNRKIRIYKSLPRLDFTTTCYFNENTIGDFYADETKLNVYWPTTIDGRIFYDIPFGVQEGRELRPLFAITWLAISNKEATLAYINKGTPKHWVRNGVISNVLAWGGTTYGPRIRLPNANFHSDIRLKGKCVFEGAIFVSNSDWRRSGVTRISKSFNEPLIAFQAEKHKGIFPRTKSLLEIVQPGFITSSIWSEGKKLFIRVFETFGEVKNLDLKIRFKFKKTLIADPLAKHAKDFFSNNKINKFQIFTLLIEAKGDRYE